MISSAPPDTSRPFRSTRRRVARLAVRASKAVGGLRTRVSRLLDNDSDRGQVQRSALMVFSIRVASAAIAFASQVLLARWMGSFEYGIFVFVWVCVLVLGGLSPLGVNIAMLRFVSEYNARSETGLLRGLLLRGRLIILANATALAVVSAGVLWWFPGLLEDHFVAPAFIVLACVPLLALTDAQDCIGRAFSWMRLALIPPYILRPLVILVAMIIAGFAGFAMVATTAAVCAVIAASIALGVQFVVLQRRLARDVPGEPRAYDTRLWMTTAFPIMLVEAIDLLLYNTDILLISHYMSPNDVAIYFAALKTIGLVNFVHYAVGSSIANRVASAKARGDDDALRGYIRDAAAWTFFPSLAGVVGLLALGYPLLAMYGSEFTGGYGAMFVLAIGLIMRAAVGPSEFVLNMMGEQRVCAAVLGATLVLNIVLNVLLIPVYGILGAAIATTAARSVASIAFYGAAKWRLGIDISILSLLNSREDAPAS